MTARIVDPAPIALRRCSAPAGPLFAIVLACAACRSDAAGDTPQNTPKDDSGSGAGCCFFSCYSSAGTTYKVDSAAVDEASCAKLASESCASDATDSVEGNNQFVFACDCAYACAPYWWPTT